MKRVLLSLYHYACFFLLMAFIITCCMLLFLNTMSDTMGIKLEGESIKTAAWITFGNVVFLSLVCTIIDALRRKFTVEKPVNQIVSAAERIAKGDYSVRIEPLRGLSRADGLDEIVDCYNKMAKELSGIESMQSDFVSNVSHEMKTPIAVIQSYASLISAPSLTEEERNRCAEGICAACKRLSELVTNILRLSKLENQQIYSQNTVCGLCELVSESIIGFEQVIEQSEISLETDMDDGVTVVSDPELLMLVFNNLISNALKFTPRGGRVCVSVKSEAECASVTVSDNGCGMSKEVGRRIFDKFYQGDPSHATSGNGLGLALVKRVIDILGASITVESEVGKGSTFTVKIAKNGVENG